MPQLFAHHAGDYYVRVERLLDADESSLPMTLPVCSSTAEHQPVRIQSRRHYARSWRTGWDKPEMHGFKAWWIGRKFRC
jgi:hypothetical protein